MCGEGGSDDIGEAMMMMMMMMMMMIIMVTIIIIKKAIALPTDVCHRAASA